MKTKKAYHFLAPVIAISLLVACKIAPIHRQGAQYASPAAMAEALVADPDYLQPCRENYPLRVQGQQSYLNILPGKTPSAMVASSLGTPKERFSTSESRVWDYGNFTISMRADIVNSINVRDDRQLFASLEKLLQRYGCPQLIFAIDTLFDNLSGNYRLTRFAYYAAGFEIDFYEFPASLSDTPGAMGFFKPQSLEDYLTEFDYINYDFDEAKPALWSEAVRE